MSARTIYAMSILIASAVIICTLVHIATGGAIPLKAVPTNTIPRTVGIDTGPIFAAFTIVGGTLVDIFTSWRGAITIDTAHRTGITTSPVIGEAFIDVAAVLWQADAISAAVKKGITTAAILKSTFVNVLAGRG